MQKNNFNDSDSINGISLQLRSKEVSEVMGNIPTWIGSWGTFLIFFLFAMSMLVMLNVQCVQRIKAKAVVETYSVLPDSSNYSLKVYISTDDSGKIRRWQNGTLLFAEEDGNLNRIKDIRFSMGNIKDNNRYTIQTKENKSTIQNILRRNPALKNKPIDCQILIQTSVFKKVFGALL